MNEVENIFKQLCLCTSPISIMLVRRKISKKKLTEIHTTLTEVTTNLQKLIGTTE